MFGLVTLHNLLFHGRLRRHEPDPMKEDITEVQIVFNKLGVTAAGVRSLLKKVRSADGVVFSDDMEDKYLREASERGAIVIHVANNFLADFRNLMESIDIVNTCRWYGVMSKARLKKIFPDKFEGLHYCEYCSSELESEDAFCTRNNCYYAVQNVRQTLKQQIQAGEVEEVVPHFLTAEAVPGSIQYYCSCNDRPFWSDWEADEDGDIKCPGCGDFCEPYSGQDTGEEDGEW